ncbi:MAG: hypothetical protein EZS28_034371 [Streblomastix strix]|uniref:Uncharacterized protein n=1 Tax=Streblomastix strix TaxID=222440 RepID=A0A5J4UJJ8_9EUKA|nr:MAG: hypothetical protein EZS28_034371 [Streblomastix strix]
MKPVITKHPILQQKKILSYGVETISGYKCLDFQYYDEETKKAGNGVKHRYICMEREGDVTCKVEKRYSYNMDMSHSCSVMNFRKMVNGFKKQQQTSDQPISERLIQRICAVIAETRLAFLAAESESIRDLIIEAVKIGQDNKDIAAELLVPRFD